MFKVYRTFFIAFCSYMLLVVTGCGTVVPIAALPTTTPLVITSPLPVATPSLVARSTFTPSPTSRVVPIASPTAAPSPTPMFTGYAVYHVQPGDTLETISTWGVSSPSLVSDYNHLAGVPQVGRELIVPRLMGQASTSLNAGVPVVRGITRHPWVALTLDCGGENPRTYDILKTLRQAHVHITFFLLGQSIAKDPTLLRQMVADGHELGNHSFTHADFTTLTDAQIAQELQHTEDLVHTIAGPRVSIRPFFRFPYGQYDVRTLRTVIAHGYLPIHWTLDSLDGMSLKVTSADIAHRLTTKLPPDQLPGAILLSHCTARTADALPTILETFKKQGIEVHSLSDVLGL